jgi:HlyD family secretion protein
MRWIKRAGWTIALALLVGGVIWFAWPGPIPVDLAEVTTGPMEVTIDDEATTRVRHVYTVSAPISGRVLRISNPATVGDVSLHVGDKVNANETVIAVMQPTSPSFLDIRSREELQAATGAAEAAVKLAEAEVRRVEAALAFSRQELERARSLAATRTISDKALDAAELDVATNEAALASATAQLDVRRSEHALANARLIGPAMDNGGGGADCCIRIRAPISGQVLRILQESESVVAAGTPLAEIGDPLDLEIAAELLSTDAVQVDSGARVRIDGWGGPALKGRVTRVEPEGFAKVSALGIEEQRVRTIIDFVDPPDTWSALGNDFRVIVHVSLWSSDKALLVPVPALFRQGEDWAVFAVEQGRARLTVVEIGHRNERVAEVLSGLSPGDPVILHPSDRIEDGVAVAERELL